jgi:hypothetical protein
MRDDTRPDHWHFHSEAAAELDLQLKRFKAILESLAAEIAAAETTRPNDESPEIVYRRHVAGAAGRLIRSQPIAVRPNCQVFISHKTEDQPFAEEIQAKLAAKGLKTFVAAASVVTGSEWQESIFDAMSACNVVIILVTQRSRSSEWCTMKSERRGPLVRTSIAYSDMSDHRKYPQR